MVYRPQERIFSAAALSTPVVPLLDLQAHLRLDVNDEDPLIQAAGITAAAMVEKYTQRLLSVRACTVLLPGLPLDQEPIELPGGTIASLTSVTVDGVAVTGCTTAGNSPALLIPATNWGSTVALNYPVSIAYTAGFASVPVDLQWAIKMIVGELFINRDNTGSGGKMPFGAMALMQQWRIASI